MAEHRFKCKNDISAREKAKARKVVVDEYVEAGRIQEVIAEQKLACATPTPKNKRECPQRMSK